MAFECSEADVTQVDHMTGSEEPVFHEVTVIEGSARRRNWSREEKARIVAESLDPDVSVSAVARRHGVNPNQLFTWRRQLRDEVECWRSASDMGVDEDVEPPAAQSPMTIEVVLDGVTVRVANGADATTLRRVLTVLRGLR